MSLGSGNWFQKFIYSFKKKNKSKTSFKEAWNKKDEISKEIMGWNVYEAKPITYSEHVRKWHWIQFVVKYKIVAPVFVLVHRFLRSYLVKGKDIPDDEHNRFLKVKDRAFESALTDWNLCVLRNHKFDDKGFKYWKKRKNAHYSSQLLKVKHEIELTFDWYDSAYKEFENLYLYYVYKEVSEMLKDNKELHHLIMTSNILPMQYYKMYPVVASIGNLKKEQMRIEPVYNNEKKDKEFRKAMDKATKTNDSMRMRAKRAVEKANKLTEE